MGEACDRFADSFCGRMIQCNIEKQGNKGTCVAALVAACCGDSKTCQWRIQNGEAALSCEQAIPRTDCGVYAAHQVPAVCNGAYIGVP